MSLILEALRKSEAERRRGLAPDVAMELPPPAPARNGATPPWTWPALAVLVLGLGGLGWWWLRADPAPAAVDVVPVASPATDADAGPAPPMVVRRQAPAASAPTPVPVASAPPPAAVAAGPQPGTVDTGAPPAPTVPAPPPRPAPMPVPAPAIADVPDLDASGLAPVKLTMHMWDEVPARRFVILDGQRMAEGDRSGGLTVLEIRRDGVVVERDGQRARVPLP